MQVLFVHGMGRSPLSGWPMLRHLRRAGLSTTTFAYLTSRASLENTSGRLVRRIAKLSAQGPMVVVGHSLGGLLLRHALMQLPQDCKPPLHLFLLGSPISASCLAQRLSSHWFFRVLTRDCGQFLGSNQRMASVGRATIPTTSIVGTKGLTGRFSPFGNEPNDGVVSVLEANAEWLTDQVQIPVVHTLLPSSARVAAVISQRLKRYGLEVCGSCKPEGLQS